MGKIFERTPANYLSMIYLPAFFVMGAFCVFACYIFIYLINQSAYTADLLKKVEHKRSLVQKIALYSDLAQNQNKENWRLGIQKSLHEFKSVHNEIKDVVKSDLIDGSRKSEKIRSLYIGEAAELDILVQSFLREASSTLQMIEGNAHKSASHPMILELGYMATGPLDRVLQDAIDGFEILLSEKIKAAKMLQIKATVAILMILLIEAVFIFYPLVNGVNFYQARLKRQAMEDYLTGLSNRRFFLERLEIEIIRSNRQKLPFVVAVIDLDRFKAINDQYGHATGDAVLKHFAEISRLVLRGEDEIGRIGGEEFAVLLPHTTDEAGYSTLERLRKLVENATVEHTEKNTEGSGIRYTISIGMLVVDADSQLSQPDEAARLLSEADKALYAAKGSGRNKIVAFKSESREAENIWKKPVKGVA
jgi:diguanylate cyclase (GGDEF)-like protein